MLGFRLITRDKGNLKPDCFSFNRLRCFFDPRTVHGFVLGKALPFAQDSLKQLAFSFQAFPDPMFALPAGG